MPCENEDSKFKGKKYLYSAQKTRLTLREVLVAFQEISNLDLYYIGSKKNNDGTSDIKAYIQFNKKISLFNSTLGVDGQIYKCTERRNLVDFIKQSDEFICNEEDYYQKKLKTKQSQKKFKIKQEKQEQKISQIDVNNVDLLKLTLQDCLSLELINILDLFRIQTAYQKQVYQK